MDLPDQMWGWPNGQLITTDKSMMSQDPNTWKIYRKLL